ncbi:hypothetical protein DTO027B5_3900 [Paecilomyces variotii]|nr:hypothetical protein DTO207G8_2139 [Paecilomyces variotii]KAJ9325872.1 hypothetical protein DTO027B3_3191 [Paecilomyces variotii]KAJ9334418.1 hypothetical protein DTO027B5_3900 [Paecilomyces variotii]KAJ9383733.1 hypothetical protein DTO063F5_5037 [Paecilomyces variotii]
MLEDQAASPGTRIAILMNTSSSIPFFRFVRTSFTTTASQAVNDLGGLNPGVLDPTADIHFYDPIVAQSYPDPSYYDLIILSGGTADVRNPEPWVEKMLAYIRHLAESFPEKKMVGICWGHQAICAALGGTVIAMEEPELGIRACQLTEEGKSFFPFAAEKGTYRIHQFHKRQVDIPVPGFISLAENNQVFLSPSKNILTLQGHPEMNGDLASMIMDHAFTYIGSSDHRSLNTVKRSMQEEHDGVKIFRKILEWASGD